VKGPASGEVPGGRRSAAPARRAAGNGHSSTQGCDLRQIRFGLVDPGNRGDSGCGWSAVKAVGVGRVGVVEDGLAVSTDRYGVDRCRPGDRRGRHDQPRSRLGARDDPKACNRRSRPHKAALIEASEVGLSQFGWFLACQFMLEPLELALRIEQGGVDMPSSVPTEPMSVQRLLGAEQRRGHATGTDARPQPDPAGPGRTHNTAADLRSCWSAAVSCWCWMVAQALSYSNPGELRVRVTALARAAGWTR
jgi:hypothetical protein